MGTVLWTISKAERRRSWQRTWFCLQLPEHPFPRQLGRLRWHGLLRGSSAVGHLLCSSWADRGHEGEGESHISSIPALQAQHRASIPPRRRGKIALFFPSLLPHPSCCQGRTEPWKNANKSMKRTKCRIRHGKQRISWHDDTNNFKLEINNITEQCCGRGRAVIQVYQGSIAYLKLRTLFLRIPLHSKPFWAAPADSLNAVKVQRALLGFLYSAFHSDSPLSSPDFKRIS